MCLSLLNLSYKLILQFEKSQTVLDDYFQICGLKTKEQVNQHDQKNVEENCECTPIPVELIAGENRYDVKDLIIVVEENEEPQQYDGFLKNLGTEISASFVNDRLKNSKKNQADAIVNSISIIKKNKTLENGNVLEEQSRDFFKIKQPKCKLVTCRNCDKTFPTKKHFSRHLRQVHYRKSTEQSLLCQQCGWLAKSQSGLYHHIMSKHKERKFECNECGKKFLSLGHVEQHKVAHMNIRSHLCNICGKSFNYSNALTYHMRIHTGEKKYKCTFCDRSFSMMCSQKRHIRTHTGVRPYKCQYCEKAFRSRGEVNCHEMLHTGYRPYHCKYCGKGFTKTHNLKLHILGHPGPHACEICGKTFVEVDYLKMHMKASHADSDLCGTDDNAVESVINNGHTY